MTSITVEVEGDKVILVLDGRTRNCLISIASALKVAEAIDQAAAIAELEPPELNKGEQWHIQVESFDGQVGFKFNAPNEECLTRVPLPVKTNVLGHTTPKNVARMYADMIRSKAAQAEHKMRIVLEKAPRKSKLQRT